MEFEPRDITVGVTDRGWYEFLRDRRQREVNFWRPSGRRMKIPQGTLFLFRLRGVGKVAGGAVFFRSDVLSVRAAWDCWGIANGCADEEAFIGNLQRLRSGKPGVAGDTEIGCSSMIEAFFLDEEDWFEAPGWPPAQQMYQTFAADSPDGVRLQELLRERLLLKNRLYLPEEAVLEDFGRPRPLQEYRLGQGSFRLQILENYNRQCAVSEEKTLPVLEAAHIRPYSRHRDHSLSNGLLLRVDIRKLYSEGLVSITPDRRFHVSPEIRNRYRNGRHYYELEGRKINVPEDEALRPNPEFLQEHYESRFKR